MIPRHNVLCTDPTLLENQRSAAAFRRVVEGAGFLHRGAPLTDDEVVRYFWAFYALLRDEVTTFSPEYASEIVERLFPRPGQDHGAMARWGNMPGEHVMLQRINLGLLALLGRLHASANWFRVAEELWPFVNAPPSTALGREEAAWRAQTGR